MLLAMTPAQVSGKELSNTPGSQTRYLLFQVFSFSAANAEAARMFPSQTEIASTVRNIIKCIGTTGDAHNKLGLCVGPITFSNSDEEILRLIQESFRIARENNVALAFHVDDQMFWDKNNDLLKDKTANIEWLNWREAACTGRRLDWGPTPERIEPQLCLNSPAVRMVVTKRAYLIGSEIKREVDKLQAEGKAELFAGVIAGWETQIGRDFATNGSLGYHALSNRGLSSSAPPAQCDAERSKVVKEFIETWARSLAHAGVPANKIYAHIAFTDQGLTGSPSGGPSYAQQVDFATPDVAFSKFYRPGFSTYPLGNTLEEVRKEVASRGNPPWISAEGTNVVPNGMPGEATMETYLGKMFNHGAVMVNVFSWGIGGESQKNNFFRRATENAECLSAYRKFLSGRRLQELSRPAGEFSPTKLQQKIQTIRVQVPKWIERTGRTDAVAPLMTKLDESVRSNRFRDADKLADEILNLVTVKSAGAR
jgi:hypothetical protein